MALSASRLGKRIGQRWILSDVSFNLEAGAILAILGPNGAGKSSLLKLAAGVWGRSQGELWRFGEAVPREGATDRRVGFLGHRSFLYPELTARENLWLQARLWGLAHGHQQVERALKEVGLAFAADEAVRTFSRGMVQRLAVARLFLTDPRLILLDEPYTGLDGLARELLDHRLARFKGEGGAALLVTHDPAEALRVGDAVAYMRGGRIEWWTVAEGWTATALTAHYRAWLKGPERRPSRGGGSVHP